MPSPLSTSLSHLPSVAPKVTAVEASLQQSLENFKDLICEFGQLYNESQTYKTELISQKEKCESKCCSSAAALKEVIAAKDNIIQLVASVLTKLNETKNFAILNDAFKILCGEVTSLTPPQVIQEVNIKCEKKDQDKDTSTPLFSRIRKNLISPKKELCTSGEDASLKDESVSEIEGTPTGRTSPIIQSKKLRSTSSTSSPVHRDKKKCPEEWATPEVKAIKLCFSGTKSNKSGRYRQTRLNIVKEKPTTVVDLTSSPECAGDPEVIKYDRLNEVQLLIKKESSENDDTILPSPTSGPTNFTLSKLTIKDKPEKFKRPLSLKTRTKEEIESKDDEMEVSVNILNPNRPKKLKQSPIKAEVLPDDDVTHCDVDSSMSLLKHLLQSVNDIENQKSQIIHLKHTPSKPPLCENINVSNVPQCDIGTSMSLLEPRPEVQVDAIDNNKRKSPKNVEPIYKEPTVRKKAEKRALPAWVCDECKTFFGELYKDDPDMIEKLVARCSKHRGRTNPARPKTPPGFWNPRWDVPEDTEEFNRRNNAV